ncbi:MAG: DUF169 domain-containing protein [candidate division Zixibacteria bacterium]|nr:DUF169 domain-containing protein [candidate division Zixibacteria bacterium]MDD5426233.1 DUF169 domain-containing protein [candidate division Zixibacteria bacterium]
MDLNFKDGFIDKWTRYFPGASLPVAFFYTDDPGEIPLAPELPEDDWQCLICQLGKVRQGNSIAFSGNSLGCGGAKRSLGFEQDIRPNFEFFLSCGLAGHIEGIRYKKNPALVKAILSSQPPFKAPGRYIVFKRFDSLTDDDQPEAVIFYTSGDHLAGLFSLVNFDEPTPHGVMTPSGAGCATIVYYPYHEARTSNPRAVLGMFDISARPCVSRETVTLAVPFGKFKSMTTEMDESFLITPQWDKIRNRQ